MSALASFTYAVRPFVNTAQKTAYHSLKAGEWATYDAHIRFALDREETSVPALDEQGNAFACSLVTVNFRRGEVSVTFSGAGVYAHIPEREAEFIALAAAAWREQFGFDLDAVREVVA